jgi:hypothetical protein
MRISPIIPFTNSLRKVVMQFLLPLLFAVWAFAEDPVAPLPPEAQRVMDKHEAALDAAKRAYEIAVAKANADAAKALEPIMVKFTKAGKLEDALAVKAAMEKMAAPVNQAGSKGGKTDESELYVGTWEIENLTTLKVLPDGTAFWGGTPGTWTKGGQTIKFSWGNEIDIPTARKCSVVDHGRGGITYRVIITKNRD